MENISDLVVFSDGSRKAFGAVACVRWHLMDGSIKCALFASKSKLAPLRQVTVPRLELCGAVMACRLRRLIEEEMERSFNTVVHITDSEIVRGQIQKESFRFNTYVGNRIADIQEKIILASGIGSALITTLQILVLAAADPAFYTRTVPGNQDLNF